MAALPWPQSRQPVTDLNGDVIRGARLQFFKAGGTTSAVVAYSDNALSTPLPSYPDWIPSDASGRWPRVYLPYGVDYRERVMTPNGDILWDDDNISNPAQPEPDPPNPTTRLVQTGSIIPALSLLPSCVALNGQTIGNALSGATGRASDDCLALFTYVYNALTDALAPVIGGRSGSPSVDFAAGKQITMPDFRGRALVGVAGMGASISTILNGVTWDGSGGNNLPSSTTGVANHTLTIAQLPIITPAGTITFGTATVPAPTNQNTTGSTATPQTTGNWSGSTVSTFNVSGLSATFDGTPFGSGNAHPNMQPTGLVVYNIAL